jgi:TolB-like protein
MSSDPEQDYFSDGISEELLNVLAQFQDLRVAARTSSFQFKGDNQDIGKIAEQLKVAHVLEGSVRKSGTRLRITAQLIKASDGYHLWSETYDRELDDVFAIQDEIAAAIGNALEAELGLGIDAGDARQPEVLAAANTQAYDAFLHGRALIHLRGREALEDAVRHLERSLRLDANYAPAHAQLAIATIMLLESTGTYGDLSMAEVTRRATPHMNLAFELAPDLSEAYAARGLMAIHTGDWELAVADTRKALESNPSYTDAMNWQSIALTELGRYQEANDLQREMLDVDPMSVIARLNQANDLIFRGYPEQAHKIADGLLPQSAWASYWKHADAALYSGQVAECIEWGLKAYAENPNDLASSFVLMDGLSQIGEYAEARRVAVALTPFAEVAAGNGEEAVRQIVARQLADQENLTLIMDAANIAHAARRFDIALGFYNELARREGPGKSIGNGFYETLMYAWNQRHAGDDQAAARTIEIVTNDLSALLDAGLTGRYRFSADAILAAYRGNREDAIENLSEAVAHGLYDPLFLGNALFDGIRDDPRFVDLESKALQALEVERVRALQIICFANPAPNAWQPLPQTCQGVEKAVRL